MEADNVYLEQIERAIPRLFALFNTDELSKTYGVGDRYYWAWKLTDFGNGTFQGAVHGLSFLLSNNLLPYGITTTTLLERIDAIFKGAAFLRRKNGSYEEAFPYESSFCTTALVAYDLLSAIRCLEGKGIENCRERYLSIVEPSITYLLHNDENHAFISNHLATAAAALFMWNDITGDVRAEKRGWCLLDNILEEQSTEGWYREYEGADPGYQSLCICYLSDLHLMRPDIGLDGSLKKAVEFLSYFAHPDGSFGGNYGSRNTRFYFPSGIEQLVDSIDTARCLALFMRHSIRHHLTVTLDSIDDTNLVPMFNSYCKAAVVMKRRFSESRFFKPARHEAILPALHEKPIRIFFKEAGLFVEGTNSHYTVISVYKGGTCYHFPKTGENPVIDTGIAVKLGNGRIYTSQAYNTQNNYTINDDFLEVVSTFNEYHGQVQKPFTFFLLRLFCITIMQVGILNRFVKRALVSFLITGKKKASIRNIRKIHLGQKLKIEDKIQGSAGRYSVITTKKTFYAIHMASQGYWQIQDDCQ